MKKGILLILVALFILTGFSGCDLIKEKIGLIESKEEIKEEKKEEEKKVETKTEEKKEENKNNTTNTTIEEEINDFGEETISEDEPVSVNSDLINCKDCVFAFYTSSKKFGDVLTNYTKDYSTLRNSKGIQRRRFMGHIIDSNNKILRAYACGIEKGKAYCIEGTTDGSKYEENISILNKVFDSSECKKSDNRYFCSGETNADTRNDGYVSVYYDENCNVFERGEMYCW